LDKRQRKQQNKKHVTSGFITINLQLVLLHVEIKKTGGSCRAHKETKNGYCIVDAKRQGMRPLRTLRFTWEDNIKMNHRKKVMKM
jgi:hypothetical protein